MRKSEIEKPKSQFHRIIYFFEIFIFYKKYFDISASKMSKREYLSAQKQQNNGDKFPGIFIGSMLQDIMRISI